MDSVLLRQMTITGYIAMLPEAPTIEIAARVRINSPIVLKDHNRGSVKWTLSTRRNDELGQLIIGWLPLGQPPNHRADLDQSIARLNVDLTELQSVTPDLSTEYVACPELPDVLGPLITPQT